jgi:hypothetical protein
MTPIPATVATSHKGIFPGSDIVFLRKYPNSKANRSQLVKEVTGKENSQGKNQ